MKITVIIPVGPGHEDYLHGCTRSVEAAWRWSPGPFSDVKIVPIPDLYGKLGRSRARNQGLDRHPSDWHFLLDCDDEMLPQAFALVDFKQAATFGAVYLNQRGVKATYKRNIYPVTRETLFSRGAHGTLSMGCFLRGDLGLRFDESMDIAEDFDFYLRLPDFVKRPEPLVCIGYDRPSSSGPRGSNSRELRWLHACDVVIDRYRAREVA